MTGRAPWRRCGLGVLNVRIRWVFEVGELHVRMMAIDVASCDSSGVTVRQAVFPSEGVVMTAPVRCVVVDFFGG